MTEPTTHDHQDEHTHDEYEPVDLEDRGEFVPDAGVQAYVTTITLVLAHTHEIHPKQIVVDIKKSLEDLGIQGVIDGVAAVELRGDGGLIGL